MRRRQKIINLINYNMRPEEADTLLAETFAARTGALEERKEVVSARIKILQDRIERLKKAGGLPRNKEIGRFSEMEDASEKELDVLEKRIGDLEAQLLPENPENN